MKNRWKQDFYTEVLVKKKKRQWRSEIKTPGNAALSPGLWEPGRWMNKLKTAKMDIGLFHVFRE